MAESIVGLSDTKGKGPCLPWDALRLSFGLFWKTFPCQSTSPAQSSAYHNSCTVKPALQPCPTLNPHLVSIASNLQSQLIDQSSPPPTIWRNSLPPPRPFLSAFSSLVNDTWVFTQRPKSQITLSFVPSLEFVVVVVVYW